MANLEGEADAALDDVGEGSLRCVEAHVGLSYPVGQLQELLQSVWGQVLLIAALKGCLQSLQIRLRDRSSLILLQDPVGRKNGADRC